MSAMLHRRHFHSLRLNGAAPEQAEPWRVSRPLGVNRHVEIATCASFFEYKGKRYLWYPDRKHHHLGECLIEGMPDLCDPGKKS